MAMLDDIFMEELVDDPEPLLTEDPQMGQDQDNEDENSEQPPLNPSEPSADAARVEPKKKVVRNPQPKLNPQRLTGPRGIQCIEQYFKNVKFKGKGHELHDLNTIMGNLEHWANRLYPKANFDDVLKKLEVLGHKRPVMTHIKKIRLDMISEPEQDSNLVLSDNETSEQTAPRTADDIFDELLTERSARPPPPARELTAEQRERIERNRQLAEQKRQQRLAAEADKTNTLANIQFQNALLESEGERREAILETGGVETTPSEPKSDNEPEASEPKSHNTPKASEPKSDNEPEANEPCFVQPQASQTNLEARMNDIPTDTEMSNGIDPSETLSMETITKEITDNPTEAESTQSHIEPQEADEEIDNGPRKKQKLDSEDISELVKDIGDEFFGMEDEEVV